MQIDVISDTVCPWCLIGKRRLEGALAARPDLDVRVTWRAYQLNPDLPPEGMARDAYLQAKFGGSGRAKAIYDQVRQAGAEEELAFAFDKIERAPNTLDSHRLIRWAGSARCQDAVVEALFDAYFFQGRDISDHGVLTAIADNAGMDAALVARLLKEGQDRDRVAEEVAQVRRMGITGVPTFIFEGQYAVQGAQNTEVLGQVITKVAQARKTA